MYLRVLWLFLVGLVSVTAACGALSAAKSPAQRFAECTANAFLPVAGTYERAVAIAADVRAKRVSVLDVLDAAQATRAEAEALDSALRACVAQAKAELASADADAAE